MNTKDGKLSVNSFVVAVYPDWDLKSAWKLVKPYLYEDSDGKLQAHPIKVMPDGEPTHWDIVLIRGDKDYYKVSEEMCNCDLSSGEICPHWRELRI